MRSNSNKNVDQNYIKTLRGLSTPERVKRLVSELPSHSAIPNGHAINNDNSDVEELDGEIPPNNKRGRRENVPFDVDKAQKFIARKKQATGVYTQEEKELLVNLTFMEVIGTNEIPLGVKVNVDERKNDQRLYDDRGKKSGSGGLSKQGAIDTVSESCFVSKRTLSGFVNEILGSDDACFDNDGDKDDEFSKIYHRNISILAVLEMHACWQDRWDKGLGSTVKTLQNHLNSDTRIKYLEVDKQFHKENTIRRALTEMLGMTYDEIKRMGKPKLDKDVESREVRQEKRNKVIRHFITDYYLDKQLENKKLVSQVSMDESYIGNLHASDHSLMETSEGGAANSGMESAVRSSMRICMIGAVSRNGLISMHKDVDGKSEIIPDCAYLKKDKGKSHLREVDEKESGGNFKELDNEGKDRSTSAGTDDIDIQKDGVKKLTAFCQKHGIDTTKPTQGSEKPKSKNVSELRQAVKAKFPEKDTESKTIQQRRVQQILNFDYDKMRERFSNLAKTSLKFFIANQAVGDYHDNMDNDTFFKVIFTDIFHYFPFCFLNYYIL